MKRTLTLITVLLGAVAPWGSSALSGAHPASAPPVSVHAEPCAAAAPTAAARGATAGRGQDTRGITAAEQRRIDARTRKILESKKARRAPRPNKIDDVPVYVHVMTSKTGLGNVTDAQITQQIAVLNQTYAGRDTDKPGRLNTGVHFTLAGTDRYANSTWHHDGQSTTYRARTRLGGKNALNIWVVDFDYLGIATFPWDYAGAPTVDGIRVQYSSLPGGSATHYDQGETATHETGHWLGLFHTFQGGCTTEGDSVADTPAQASPSTGCPATRDSCSLPGKDPVHNYLDYSYDSCYYEFTAGQSARIAQMWKAYRA